MEYELFGASMICSTWSERLTATLQYCTREEVAGGVCCTYQGSEVRYLEGRIVARNTSNFIVPTIDLESHSTFTTMRGGGGGGRLGERETSKKDLRERTHPFPSLHCVFGRVPGRGDRVIC